MIIKIWGSAEISTVRAPFLKILSCRIFFKKFLVTFYCCFFRFFSKNCQKVKVTNLTKNDQNYQILLETCFLISLDTIWWIFYHSIINMSFCDMRNREHKIEIWAIFIKWCLKTSKSIFLIKFDNFGHFWSN